MDGMNRRDFLKLAATVPLSGMFHRLAPDLIHGSSDSAKIPNIIIIVIDTLSARNMSLYGYPRKTTPNLDKFSQRATVYHGHHSAGNFTVPGTASLLTGTYPWTHRGMNFPGLIDRDLVRRNIFKILPQAYNRIAFTQNPWAMHLLAQFNDGIDWIIPSSSFSAANLVFGEKFTKDLNTASFSLDEFLFRDVYNPPPSLVFGSLERFLLRRNSLLANREKRAFPDGMPSQDFAIYFYLNELFNGLYSAINKFPSPYLAYIHLWGVHQPYSPEQSYFRMFHDGWKPEEKPRHPLAEFETYRDQLQARNRYDEYIANFDFELGKLLNRLEQLGTLENTYVFITSDHGESCERGYQGHGTPLMFEPLIHVPLMVFSPGQRERVDVYSLTNNVDILPTLAVITNQGIPEWCEGFPLPEVGGTQDPQRVTFSSETKYSNQDEPFKTGSIVLLRGRYKLVRYDYSLFDQYDRFSGYELYDLENDPEELNNLYSSLPKISNLLQEELQSRLDLANQSHQL